MKGKIASDTRTVLGGRGGCDVGVRCSDSGHLGRSRMWGLGFLEARDKQDPSKLDMSFSPNS